MDLTKHIKLFKTTVRNVINANNFIRRIYPRPEAQEAMWDFIAKDSSWLKKYSQHPWDSASAMATYRDRKQKLSEFTVPRLSGMLQFKKTKSSANMDALDQQVTESATDPDDDSQKVTYKRQFAKYCRYTTLHGYRYITETHRHLTER